MAQTQSQTTQVHFKTLFKVPSVTSVTRFSRIYLNSLHPSFLPLSNWTGHTIWKCKRTRILNVTTRTT